MGKVLVKCAPETSLDKLLFSYIIDEYLVQYRSIMIMWTTRC